MCDDISGIRSLYSSLWSTSSHPSACVQLRESTTPCQQLERVPFTHPSQIFPIITILRLQLAFNELFKSVVSFGRISSEMLDIPFINVTPVPPQKFSVELIHEQLFLEISVKSLSPDQLELQVKRGRLSPSITLERATMVLNTCKNIPLFCQWLLSASDNNK